MSAPNMPSHAALCRLNGSTARDVDARMGMTWWNRLTQAQRTYWLDRAWRAASPVYRLDAMPSAADAWECWKADARPSTSPTPTDHAHNTEST